MTVVRISDDLISNVKASARNSLAGVRNTALQQLPTSVMDGVYDRTIGLHEADMKRLPSWMFQTWNGMDLEILVTPHAISGTGLPYLAVKNSQTVMFSTPRIMPSPEALSGSKGKLLRNGNYGSGMKYVLTAGDPFDEELLALAKNRNEGIERADKMMNDLAEGLGSVLKQFTTLAPALKACPALWDFLPEETKARHKTIKERPAGNKPDLSEVDTNRIVSLAAIAKMVK
jgi:hypothetical protein